MLNLMNDFFHSWGPKTQETQLGYLTRLPRPNDDLPNFNNAWDINELAPPDVGADGKVDPNKPSGYIATLKPYEERCMQPKYPCYPSVMFLNNCHHPQVVNYVEWGVLARLNEWKKNGSATSYGETWFSTLHNERSGYSSLRGGDITGEADEARAMMGMPPAEPQLTDPNYPDQVAMANVGWKLADDYIALMNQKVQCKLANVNQQALEALLEMYQNKERVMAKCLKGCGKYHSTFARDVCFQYIFGEVHGDYIQLSKL